MKRKEIISNNKKKIVFVGYKAKQADNSYAVSISGTGFILKGKYIITCAHVYNQIPKTEGIEIFAGFLNEPKDKIETYTSHDLVYKTHNDQFDVCVFELKENNFIPKETFSMEDLMSEKELEAIVAGTDTIFVGFPLAGDFLKLGLGVTLFANNAMIGAVKYSNADKKIDFLQIDSHVNPSNSGSPLFDVETGKIAGLVFNTFNFTPLQDKTIQIPRNMGSAKPAFRIIDLIKDIEK